MNHTVTRRQLREAEKADANARKANRTTDISPRHTERIWAADIAASRR